MNASSAKTETLALIGDASLFTAASFCVLAVVGGPLALIIGPAVAWRLHQRRLSGTVLVSEVIGLLLSLGVVGGGLGVAVAIFNRLWPPPEQDFTAPLVILISLSTLFLALMVGLAVNGLRDLLTARRQHPQLDYARLIATAVIVVFGVIIVLVQQVYPAMGIGEAGIFALGAALIGAATMLVMKPLNTYWEKRGSSINT